MLPLPQRRYVDGARQADVYERILEGVQQRRGLQAALVFPSPLEGASASGRFAIEGQPETSSRGNQPFAALTAISPDYFRTMGIPLISGRTFTNHDRPPASPPVILNAVLARKYFAGEDPVGKRIRFGAPGSEWITIVGVVGDTRNMGISEDPAPILYVPFRHLTLPFMSVVMRGSGGAAAAGTAVRESIRNVDSELAVDSVLPMRTVVRESIAAARFGTLLVSAFAIVALALAAVGLYGVDQLLGCAEDPGDRYPGRARRATRPGHVASHSRRDDADGRSESGSASRAHSP